jgi:coatomer subunit gamma
MTKFVIELSCTYVSSITQTCPKSILPMVSMFIDNLDSAFSWGALEIQLQGYLSNPDHSKPFDISTVPVVSKAQEQQDLQKIKQSQSELTSTGGVEEVATPVANLSTLDQQSFYAKTMSEIPQLAQLGVLFKSSKPVSLTESEEEYQITCIKHVFPKHFVFQVNFLSFNNSSLNVEIL